jgi:hypothetical protein
LMKASDVIAIVALVFSLIASGIATRFAYQGTKKSQVSATYSTATSMVLEIDRLVVQYPAFWPYLYERKEIDPKDPERNKLLAAANMILDILEYIWERRGDFQSTTDRDAWRDWMLHLFEMSPSVTALYEAQPEWYPHLKALHDDG